MKATTIQSRVKDTIAQADTVEKVWALVAVLLQDANGYSDAAYLENARAYTAIAIELTKES